MRSDIQMTLVSLLLATGIAASTTSSESTQTFDKRDLSDASYNRLAIIHASIGSAATMLIFPLGVLGARGLRIFTAKWWWAHAALQGIFGSGCIVAAFVLGVILNGPEHHFREGHRRTGLVLLILVVVQSIFGTMLKLAARTKIQDPDRVPAIKGHPLQNFLHIFMGLAILGLGFWQTWSGFSLIEEGSGGTLIVPLVVYIIWGVVVGVVTALYLAGLGLVPLQLRKEEQRRVVHFYGGEKAAYLAQTQAYGTTTATPEHEMRSRYMSSTHMEPRSNVVALAPPVDVSHPEPSVAAVGTSQASLEQEILERQRRNIAVPLIHRS